jgi:hypothetical protein
MAGMHIVKQGECLSTIALQYGFADYRRIYDHARNSSLRSKRPNPNLLYPGDQVFIPDHDVKLLDKTTDQLHRFTRKSQTVQLRIRIDDERGEPFRDHRYRLNVEDQAVEGRTDGQGLMEQEIAVNACYGEITLWVEEESTEVPYTWTLEIGDLDPIAEIAGIEARLNNLGFGCGPVDGILGDRTEEALENFQQRHRLDVTGKPDSDTRHKLLELHDGE